jgi:hypothetical protein
MPSTKKMGKGSPVPVEVIERRILLLRDHKVILDSHLAELYEVETRALVQAVKRNHARFPSDFMFQLSTEEARALRSQIVMSNSVAAERPGRGGRRYLPYGFTEQGVAMLSTVLNSDRAIAVNIAIMRTFVRLRQILATHKELAARVAALEKKYDQRFRVVFDILKQLMEPLPSPPKSPFGFTAPKSREK